MTMTSAAERWAPYIVTDDADLDAALKEKVDDLTSQELAEYAHSLGLYPPCYGPTMNPPIALAWLPGMDYEEDGVLVWDIGEDDQDNDSEA